MLVSAAPGFNTQDVATALDALRVLWDKQCTARAQHIQKQKFRAYQARTPGGNLTGNSRASGPKNPSSSSSSSLHIDSSRRSIMTAAAPFWHAAVSTLLDRFTVLAGSSTSGPGSSSCSSRSLATVMISLARLEWVPEPATAGVLMARLTELLNEPGESSLIL